VVSTPETSSGYGGLIPAVVAESGGADTDPAIGAVNVPKAEWGDNRMLTSSGIASCP
jgi:hypothetical protein